MTIRRFIECGPFGRDERRARLRRRDYSPNCAARCIADTGRAASLFCLAWRRREVGWLRPTLPIGRGSLKTDPDQRAARASLNKAQLWPVMAMLYNALGRLFSLLSPYQTGAGTGLCWLGTGGDPIQAGERA